MTTMSGRPQRLSKGQKEEVSRILRKQVLAGALIFLALLSGITGFSLWGIKSRLENKVETLVAEQFEEPSIKTIVSDVAQTKAKELLVQQINPEVERFKKQIASQLSNLKTLVTETQALKTQSDAHAKEIEKILFSLRQTQKQIEQAKQHIFGLESDLAKLERGIVEIQYFQHKGRNKFPNPYHDRIMQRLNQLLTIAVPDPAERAQFVKEIQEYHPK